MAKQTKYQLEQHLLYKYSHVGCPACHYEDNCDRPAECAENGRCLDLKPLVSGDELRAAYDSERSERGD